ncbi:host-nuclease inhibitor Gam family protein [Dyella sp. 20L07]|uniref:host-nuclease inhibitor Gam family protein n=1 Tax=Dyella sp. 20L07 TaxID=3384240 RepID=UPI003D2C658F
MHMQEIENLAKQFSGARNELAERLQALRDEQETATRRRLQGIKNALARFTAAHAELKDAVESGQSLFQKPKTRILHGIKVGFVKQKGKLDFTDDDAVVRLIRKHFPEQFDALVKTTEKPVKASLANLPASDLKRLGVTVSADGEAVVVAPVDGELDKLIKALINDDVLAEKQA